MLINIQGKGEEMLLGLASSQDISMQEALKRSLATEVHIKEHLANGSKILVLTKDKEMLEIKFSSEDIFIKKYRKRKPLGFFERLLAKFS